jgi:glycosyltransferase involved in cell wall biosynthesis
MMTELHTPLVSCLTVTESRATFMPWLLWCFDRQEYPHRELVIVDSSPEPWRLVGRDDVRVLAAPPGTGVAAKRNQALEAARGEIITWFDDDDWQHPQKLDWLVEALKEGAPYAGATRGWFVDLYEERCAPHQGHEGQILFNSAGFRRSVAQEVRFPEQIRRASDTRWLREIASRYRGQEVVLERPPLFFWLCHTRNLSNPVGRRQLDHPLSLLRDRVGDAWDETDRQLSELRDRLAPPRHSTVQVTTDRSRASSEGEPEVEPAPLPVGVVVKATVMDVPFLEPMVRHMLRQARYPFAERLVVVDREPSRRGKYRARAQATDGDLDQVLQRLLDDGIIDRALDVKMDRSSVKEVLGRYFERYGDRVSTHATTGGPIYPTLFGMEALETDYVLQMDADILFYTDGVSWVEQSLDLLQADPRLWLMMTHSGPPRGPMGASLGPRNARRSRWDPAQRLWRFRHATTRYFLCDRRRLHRHVKPLLRGNLCEPLERCISAGMVQHGAFRGNLGDLRSWHLHVWHHAPPFPQWLDGLIDAVERGRYPAVQEGKYDLRLDRPTARQAWRVLLDVKEEKDSAARPRPIRAPERVDGPRAPLAVVIPLRNRAGARVRNVLRGLHWQQSGAPAQILLVSQGSQPSVNEELSRICYEEGATLLIQGHPDQPWNKSLALNYGIRATRDDLPFLMTMDGDMILAPDFLEVVLARLRREPPALVLCRISDLPRGVEIPRSRKALNGAFPRLLEQTRLRKRSGSGAIQAASRDFFFEIRGYDEDLLWWGAMDGDILNRARLLGLELVWIENQTSMLHQWHPRKHRILEKSREIEQAKLYWRRNHDLVKQRSHTARRNPETWGGLRD